MAQEAAKDVREDVEPQVAGELAGMPEAVEPQVEMRPVGPHVYTVKTFRDSASVALPKGALVRRLVQGRVVGHHDDFDGTRWHKRAFIADEKVIRIEIVQPELTLFDGIKADIQAAHQFAVTATDDDGMVWKVACPCGWEASTSEGHQVAEQLGAAHVHGVQRDIEAGVERDVEPSGPEEDPLAEGDAGNSDGADS